MSNIARSNTGRVLHKTFTSRARSGHPPTALCGLCGWSETADPPGGPSEARALAREHLAWPLDWPVFHRGVSSRIGDRAHNTDHAGIRVDGASGAGSAWAVADAGADTDLAARAAQALARDTVDRVVGHQIDLAAALSCAVEDLDPSLRTTLSCFTGTAGIPAAVAATAAPCDEGYTIAWVGNCRAYEVRDGRLVQLTHNHTWAQRIRDHQLAKHPPAAPPPSSWDTRDRTRAVTYTGVRAHVPAVSRTVTDGLRRRLVLTTDGVHDPVPHHVLTELAVDTADPIACANLLTSAAIRHGSTDNATALVVDPIPTP